MQRVIDLIKKGTFASKGMPKSINDFFNANSKLIKEPLKLIEQLFIEVLDRYDLSPNVDESKGDTLMFGIVNPQIVLTQSFI